MICKKCNKNKDISEFSIHSKYKNKIYYKKECKLCYNLRNHKERKFIPMSNPKNKPWLEPDKLYISKTKMDRIPNKLEINRCNYCKCIMESGVNKYWKSLGYCSEWCWEMEHLDNFIPTHFCKNCGDSTDVIKNNYGKSTGVHRTLCDKCYENKYGHEYVYTQRKKI